MLDKLRSRSAIHKVRKRAKKHVPYAALSLYQGLGPREPISWYMSPAWAVGQRIELLPEICTFHDESLRQMIVGDSPMGDICDWIYRAAIYPYSRMVYDGKEYRLNEWRDGWTSSESDIPVRQLGLDLSRLDRRELRRLGRYSLYGINGNLDQRYESSLDRIRENVFRSIESKRVR